MQKYEKLDKKTKKALGVLGAVSFIGAWIGIFYIGNKVDFIPKFSLCPSTACETPVIGKFLGIFSSDSIEFIIIFLCFFSPAYLIAYKFNLMKK